jgi:CDGSH-type Zn-finger protein
MSAKVIINPNGSIRIEGDFEIVDSTGATFGLAGRTAIGLCRCGHSANKPFCDGSHKKMGFESVCPARDLPPDLSCSGSSEIKGPLRLPN